MGLKNSFFQLIHLPSCFGQFVIGQFNKPIMFVSSNPICDKQIGRPHDLVITRMIADRIGLHSVL